MVDGDVDLVDFLARADVLAAVGKTVLISDYFEYYRLAAYLARHTTEPIALTMGVPSLQDLFQEKYYSQLEGGILEAFGKLFTKDLRIYVYPFRDPATGVLSTVGDVAMPHSHASLYGYMVEGGKIEQLVNFRSELLHIFSRDVLQRIKDGDPSWEVMVPEEVAEAIKSRRLFGYRRLDVNVAAHVGRAVGEFVAG